MQLKIKKLHADTKLPYYDHPGDAGMNVFAVAQTTLQPGERKKIPLGFAMELPDGHVAFVKDRSSTSTNYGLHNLAGVCDAGYRGEYTILMINLGAEPVTIEAGEKVAQIVILPIPTIDIVETNELSETQRGSGGFGSTGKF